MAFDMVPEVDDSGKETGFFKVTEGSNSTNEDKKNKTQQTHGGRHLQKGRHKQRSCRP